MKILRKFFDWCRRWNEVATFLMAAILLCMKERTSFECMLFVLLVGIMGSVMKLRIYLQEKEERDNERNRVNK